MGLMKMTALTIVAIGMTACAHRPETPAPIISAGTAIAADPGIILIGKIVTLNDAGDVWPNARLWIREGRIEAIVKAGEPLPAVAAQARLVETGGAIYPGLIDLHNHPEYAIYPLLPITRAYKDRYEWRFYDEAYEQRITSPQIVLADKSFFNLGMEIGRYGEYKALVGGTTTLQGGRDYQPYSTSECLVRNIENSKVGAKLAVSKVDIGRDAPEWAELLKARNNGLLVLHLAEGPSERMKGEYAAIKKSGLVGPELIAIHGVGLSEEQIAEMGANQVKLVWSPLSNFLLYGKTAKVGAAKKAGVLISLAPDWAPSGSKSILGELKVADLVNKHELNSLFTARELVDMVTRNPAQAMGWADRAGQIAPGFVADLLIVDDRQADANRNLIESIEENVRLVTVRGELLYGDDKLMRELRAANDIEVAAQFGGKRAKMIAPNCSGTALPVMSLAETRARLQRGMDMDAGFLLKQATAAKVKEEFARCPGGPPDGALTADDTKRFLLCRYGLPYEKMLLSPLTTNEDPDFMTRLLANKNLPGYLKLLPSYYRQ